MAMLNATHLATVKSEVYDMRWETFSVRRPARLVAVRPCLSGISLRSAEVISISRGTATIDVSTATGLPQHYYLNILGLAYRLGCAEVFRNNERLFVRFIAPMEEEVLRRVVRADFMIGNVEAMQSRLASRAIA